MENRLANGLVIYLIVPHVAILNDQLSGDVEML